MKNILVLCTGNSCRSQIAQGYLQHFACNHVNVYSAGVEVHGVNPLAIATMKADGIDISGHTSNHIDEYVGIPFDVVITVCDNAKEQCPYFAGNALKFHQNFPDPAQAVGSPEEITATFEHVRELIKEYVQQFIQQWITNCNQ